MTGSPRTLPTRLVLLGHPVSHSLSPVFQNAALHDAGIPLTYAALDVAPSALSAVFSDLTRTGAAGNVTIPHKCAAFELCDVTTPAAQQVCAINTFWAQDGLLHGDNTDVAGFDRAVRALFPSSWHSTHGACPARVTLLGAGGAARAVAAAISAWPATQLTLWNRSASHAEELSRSFAGTRVELDLTRAVGDADLVINATPIGLHNDDVPVALDALRRDAVLYDLVYRPGETPWIRAARARGHSAADGLGMLVEQGALAFERWFDRPPNREAMWRALNGAVSVEAGAERHAAP